MKNYLLPLVLLVVATGVSCSKFGCSKKAGEAPTQDAAAPVQPQEEYAKPDYSGITVERVISRDLSAGQGATVKEGDTVEVRYGSWIYDPKRLANKGKPVSSSEGNKTFSFKVGAGEVVKGWEQGMVGMKEGGKRSIIVPVTLGYGAEGNDQVPGGSILLYEVELVKVK